MEIFDIPRTLILKIVWDSSILGAGHAQFKDEPHLELTQQPFFDSVRKVT